MTVLGDFNQAIFAHASEMVDFNTLTSLYGPDETEVINIDAKLPIHKTDYRIYTQTSSKRRKDYPFRTRRRATCADTIVQSRRTAPLHCIQSRRLCKVLAIIALRSYANQLRKVTCI